MSQQRTLAWIAGLYLIEGFPAALFQDVWPVYLRESGVSRATIGALSGLSVAWALKVLWSPLVDRFGARQHWIAGSLVALAAALLALAGVDPMTGERALWGAVAVVCFASATQDIAIDAYSIALVERGEEGPANATRVAAFRTALLLFGGGILFLPRWIGWPATHQALAAIALAFAIFAFTTPRLPARTATAHDLRAAFRGWLQRGGVVPVLGFVLLYRLPDLAMGPMVAPFWVDGGIPREEIALVKSGIGFGATLLGAALGGFLVRRLGIGRSLWLAAFLALASNLGYAVAAGLGGGRGPIYTASVIESLCSGVAAVGFMSFLMRICERAHAAVQYATLTSFAFLAGALARAASGIGAEQLGYAGFFAATAVLALPSLLLLPAAARWAAEPPPD